MADAPVTTPAPGWYVAGCGRRLTPDGRAGVLCATADEASEAAECIAADGDQAYIFAAWLCEYGGRPFWLPR